MQKLESKQPKQIIKIEFGDSKNFITPTIEGYGQLFETETRQIIYEVSSGTGFSGGSQIGITFVYYEKDTGKTFRLHELSDSVSHKEYKENLKNAARFIANLAQRFNDETFFLYRCPKYYQIVIDAIQNQLRLINYLKPTLQNFFFENPSVWILGSNENSEV